MKDTLRRAAVNPLGIVLSLGLLSAGNLSQQDSIWPVNPDQLKVKVEGAALERLLERAEAEHSSAVAIAVDGRLLAVRGEDQPISAMSASKSLASLAVGFLIDDGILELGTPASKWVPEWKGSPHEAITIKHILSHTSGLETTRADIRTGRIADHGTASKLVFEPGTRFQYNNNAVDFLAVILERAAGIPMDELIGERLFKPLGIRDAHWLKDVDGVPFAAGELEIRPTSLLAIGQVLADGGMWKGTRILSEEWIAASTAASQSHTPAYGLLWWREGKFLLSLTKEILEQWQSADIPTEMLTQIRPLQGGTFESYNDFQKLMVGRLGKEAFESWREWLRSSRGVTWAAQVEVGPQIGFSARGWLGQFLVVIPETRTVAVRMRRPGKEDFGGGPEKNAFPSFPADVSALARK